MILTYKYERFHEFVLQFFKIMYETFKSHEKGRPCSYHSAILYKQGMSIPFVYREDYFSRIPISKYSVGCSTSSTWTCRCQIILLENTISKVYF